MAKRSNENTSNDVATKVLKIDVDKDQYTFHSGIALIINNIEFDPSLELPDRRGSDVDASSLFQRFQELGFKSDLVNDATKEEIERKFDEIKNDKKKLQETDCLIVALLTHGNEECIYATNKSMNIKSIMNHFNAENCKELILKPKLFIFQAGRGSSICRGVNANVIRDQNQTDAGAESDEYDKLYGETICIPNEADFLAVYSSSLGYGAYRNSKMGSPFIRYLSEELIKMERGDDFYRVITRVNRNVGTRYKPNYPNSNNPMQMPCFVSSLTKNLILRP